MHSKLDPDKLPTHIAVIMDGNGRWANSRHLPRLSGHYHGVEAVREVTEGCAEMGISYLTLYAFSTENWNRPEEEVDSLMNLLVETIHNEITTLNKNNIKLQTIGNIQKLPTKTREALEEAIDSTSLNKGLILTLALNYSGRWEILEATKELAKKAVAQTLDPNLISEADFAMHLNTHHMPDPDMLIRTSGENRISNFLLWQLAYSEFIFLPIFWPDFRKMHLYESIAEYQNRERRYGLTGEQIKL
jgi:undecaprenyl diphosphate synthase